jgi:voltage-gated potassium channel
VAGPSPGTERPSRRSGDDDAFDAWLARVRERADPFMAWLGVLFALLLGYELAVELGPVTRRVITAVGWAIWALFAAELAAGLWLAPSRGRFLRRHWLQLAGLLVPTLRVLRFVRLLRLGRALPAARVLSTSYRTAGSARRLLRSRLGYLVAVSGVVVIAVAELAFLFERSHPRGVFPSFGDALLWSFATVVALQGDPRPASLGAQLVMLAGFTFGLVIVASLAGTTGAFLLERRGELDREER